MSFTERPPERVVYRVEWDPAPRTMNVSRPRRRLPFVHIALFTATFLTTSMAGAFQSGVDPVRHPAAIVAGFPFAVTLMSILLFHELGHYFLSRRHGVRASLPYFIPAPPVFVGTFGAFIRMKSPPSSRRALFDVGAAGPWAGLALAVPAVILGLVLSEVRPLEESEGGLLLGESVLFSFLTKLTLGVNTEDVTILLHPVALAGWFGLFVTFLNLLPVGQLDGGHVAYAMFGRRHRIVSRLFLGIVILLGLSGWEGWFVWAILLTVLGMDHPPTLDEWTPLDARRMAAGWLTAVMFAVTFMPVPISVAEPPPRFEGEQIPVFHRSPPPAPKIPAAGPEIPGVEV